VLDKTGSLPVTFPVQIIYRIVSYRIVKYSFIRFVLVSDLNIFCKMLDLLHFYCHTAVQLIVTVCVYTWLCVQ